MEKESGWGWLGEIQLRFSLWNNVFYLFASMPWGRNATKEERKSNIDDNTKRAFKSPMSKSVNQYQLGCERTQMDNWLCFN